MARCILVVPPFLKSVNGPLLGPAMLAGAAERAGHDVGVIDLNSTWIAERVDLTGFEPGPFVGDHDRPRGALQRLQHEVSALLQSALPDAAFVIGEDPALTVTYSHGEVREAAEALVSMTAVGGWTASKLGRTTAPAVVGISVLYSGQVLWALAVSLVVRRLWPSSLIVWGGPHVTALRDEIAADRRYRWAADRFVFGHAERTFVDILEAADGRQDLPLQAVEAGAGRPLTALDDPDVVPVLTTPLTTWPRPTVPAQGSRGCAYGRCTFCTYPAIEGRVRLVGTEHLLGVIEAAGKHGAVLSLKDSLVVPKRMVEIGRMVDGKARWSACTKLHPAFDGAFVQALASMGCATVEFGLETLTPGGQLLFDKHQTPALFQRATQALAGAGIAVVVNYMTGLPGGDPAEEAAWLAWVKGNIADLGDRAKVEHNRFQLERLSPMVRDPAAFGIRVLKAWPWSSVMAWERV